MVKYSAADVIALRDFEYAWRIIDDCVILSSDERLRHCFPLSVERSEQICQSREAFRQSRIVNTERYHVVSECYMTDDDSQEEDHIKVWLSDLPIHADEKVYVSWDSRTVLVTDWAFLVNFWACLWYPSDVVNVFDDTLKWAVLYGPEEFAVFVEEGSANPQSGKYPYKAGYGLVRTYPPDPFT